MKKALVVLAVVASAALSGSHAFAACVSSVPLFHGLDSYFVCDNSRGPVSAFAYQIAAPLAVNTGTERIAVDILPGQVQINTDWANAGIVGCPQGPGGNTRVIISVQCNDGRGMLLSLSGADPGVGYLVETAHKFDPETGLAFPVLADDRHGRPRVISVTATTVNIHVDPNPFVMSDCDPDSLGMIGLAGSTCPDAFDGRGTVGGIYTSTQPCATNPIVLRTAWTKSSTVLDASGNATIPYTTPVSGSCFYVGTTTTVSGVEGGSISGFISVAGGPLAAPPTAEGVRAATDSGKVRLSWSTSNEVGLAGFRLIAVSKNKGEFEIGSLIAAKGMPSSYTAEARMGDLKGARSIIIRSVQTDGTTVDAAPVNF